jgi:hypothetical protein
MTSDPFLQTPLPVLADYYNPLAHSAVLYGRWQLA